MKSRSLKPFSTSRLSFACSSAEGGVKLGFRAGLEAEIVTRAFAQIFLDDRAVLVDLHRVNAQVPALVFKFFDRFFERRLSLRIWPNISCGKRSRTGVLDPAFAEIVDDLFDVGGQGSRFPGRTIRLPLRFTPK